MKVEKNDDDSNYKTEKLNETIDENSSTKDKCYENQPKLMHQLHSTSNLPSFLQCAMLGTMVTTSQNNVLKDCYPDSEKYKRNVISPIHLQTSHCQPMTREDSWK